MCVGRYFSRVSTINMFYLINLILYLRFETIGNYNLLQKLEKEEIDLYIKLDRLLQTKKKTNMNMNNEKEAFLFKQRIFIFH